MATSVLQIFGAIELTNSSGRKVELPPSAQRLLAWLALHQGIPTNRERIIDELWPDLDLQKGRARLSQTLWTLRSAVGDDELLDSTTETIALLDNVGTDLRRFEALANSSRDTAGQIASRKEALAIAQRPLLERLDETWAEIPRSSAAKQRAKIQRSLIAVLIEAGDLGAAQDASSLWVEQNSLDEDAYREALRVLDMRGDSDEACRLFDAMRVRLSTELGVEPSEDLVVADSRRRDVQQEAKLIDTAPTPSTRTFGRKRERTDITDALVFAREGFGSTFIVSGQGGVGKSHLLDACRGDLERAGATAVIARCSNEDAPYQALCRAIAETIGGAEVALLSHQLEAPWLRRMRLLLPGFGWPHMDEAEAESDFDASEELKQQHAVIRTLEILSERKPLALLLDDFGFADAETVALVLTLAAQIDDLRLLLVIAFREDENSSESLALQLKSLERLEQTRTIALRGLNLRSLWEMARVVDPSLRLDEARELHEATAGNPLLARHFLKTQDLSGIGSGINPIAERLSALGVTSNNVLAALCLSSNPVPMSYLSAALSEHPPIEVAGAVLDLVDADLVVDSRPGYSPTHARVREFVLDAMKPEDRRRLSERLLHESKQSTPRTRAALAVAAEDWSQAADLYEHSAGDALALGALRSASDGFEAAVRYAVLADWDDERTAPLLLRLHDAVDALGDVERRRRVMEQLLSLDVARLSGEIGLRHGWDLLNDRQLLEARGVAEELCRLDDLPKRTPRGGLYRLLGEILYISTGTESVDRLQQLLAENSRLSAADEADLRFALGQILLDEGSLALSAAETARAAELFDEIGFEGGSIDARRQLALRRVMLGEGDWVTLIDEALVRARRIGDRRREGLCLLTLSSCHTAGFDNYGTARPHIIEAIPLLRGADISGFVVAANNIAAFDFGFLGRTEQHLAILDEALLAARGTQRLEGLVTVTTAEIYVSMGETRRAEELFTEAVDLYEEIDNPIGAHDAYAGLALLHASAGNRDEALRLIGRVTAASADMEQAEADVTVLAAHAEVLAILGEDQAAGECAELAVSKIARTVSPIYEILWRCGRVLRRIGSERRAHVVLDRAAQRATQTVSEFDAPLRHEAAAHVEPLYKELRELERHAQIVPSSGNAPTVSISLTKDEVGAAADGREVRLQLTERALNEASLQGRTLTARDIAQLLSIGVRTAQRDIASLDKS